MAHVVFYSVGDGASGRNLLDAALLLQNTDTNETFSINQLLEFKNVQLYFENNMFLAEWDTELIIGFNQTLLTLDPKIKKYFFKKCSKVLCRINLYYINKIL